MFPDALLPDMSCARPARRATLAKSRACAPSAPAGPARAPHPSSRATTACRTFTFRASARALAAAQRAATHGTARTTLFPCFLIALTLTVHRSDCARKLNTATGAMDPAAEAELLAERRRVEQAEAQQGTFSRPFSFFSRPFHSFPPSFPLLTSIFSRPAAAVDRRAVARAPVALPLPRHLHLRPRRTSRMSSGRYVATWLHLFADVSSA